MSVIITPSEPQSTPPTLPVCFQGVANVSIPQESLRYIDAPCLLGGPCVTPCSDTGSGGGTYDYYCGVGNLKKTSAGLGYDCEDYVTNPLYAYQPFSIQGANATFLTPSAPNDFYFVRFGVLSDTGIYLSWEVYKSHIGAGVGVGWLANIYVGVGGSGPVVAGIGVNFSENFRVRSDGVNVYFERQTAGVWVTHYVIALPTGVLTWKFYWDLGYQNNELFYTQTYRGSFQGSVPVVWSAPDGGTLTGSGNTRCFSHGVVGTYRVCIDEPFTGDGTCVDVTVEPLYFNALEPAACDGCVLADQVVYFESNGGYNGTLTATGGTVVDALTWIAPSTPGTYTITYTLGLDSIDCVIEVLARFAIDNIVDDTIDSLIHGECIQLTTNYDDAAPLQVVWENITGDLVSSTGLLCIPNTAFDNCFGAIEARIRAYVTGPTIESSCSNLSSLNLEQTITIIVQPRYPTPDVCGPDIMKWTRFTPEYKVVEMEFEGGCDEVALKSRVPKILWEIRYDGLLAKPYEPVVCGDGYQNVIKCNEGILGTVNGCTDLYKSAKRLDDFWNYVFGKYRRFYLVDYDTGEVFRNVRFAVDNLSPDHINRHTQQSRTVRLVWRGCCDRTLEGGRCPAHDFNIPDIPVTHSTGLITEDGANWIISEDGNYYIVAE